MHGPVLQLLSCPSFLIAVPHNVEINLCQVTLLVLSFSSQLSNSLSTLVLPFPSSVLIYLSFTFSDDAVLCHLLCVNVVSLKRAEWSIL